MTPENEDLTLEIPASDVLSPDQMRALPADPVVKPEKKKAAAPEKADPREAEFLASKEALRKATEERNRMEQERDAERTRAEAERTRATQLEKENHKRTGQALYANGEATYREHQAIVGAIHSAKNETTQAKRDLENALSDDNLDPRERGRLIADAQERIALASADLRSLEEGKSTLETRLAEAKARMEAHYRSEAAQTKEDPKQPEVKQAPQADPFETYVAGFPKPTQDWLRAHPEYVKDPKLNKRLVAASYEWDAEDKPMHTQDFIDSLNAKFFKPKEQPVTKSDEDVETEEEEAEEVELEAAPEPKKPAKSAPAAPVSRSGSPGKPSDKRSMKVSLNPAEIQHAIEMFGPGTKLNLDREQAMARYGRNKLKGEADGKYLPR